MLPRGLVGVLLAFLLAGDAALTVRARVSHGVAERSMLDVAEHFPSSSSLASTVGDDDTIRGVPSLADGVDPHALDVLLTSRGTAHTARAFHAVGGVHEAVGHVIDDISDNWSAAHLSAAGDLLRADVFAGHAAYGEPGSSLFNGDLFLELFGDEPGAQDDKERLQKLAAQAEKDISKAEPDGSSRTAILRAMSSANVDTVLSFISKADAKDAAQFKDVVALLGPPTGSGTFEVENVEFKVAVGGWKWRSASSSSSSWRSIDDESFPASASSSSSSDEVSRQLAKVRSKLQTQPFALFASLHASNPELSGSALAKMGVDAAKVWKGSASGKKTFNSIGAAAGLEAGVVERESKRVSDAAQRYYSVAAKYRDGEPILPWIIKAVLVGFLDGASFGLVSGFTDAIEHDTCAPHRAEVVAAFQRVAKATSAFFKGLAGGSRARGGRSLSSFFNNMVQQMVCFFKSVVMFVWKCKPLLVTIGMLVAVIGLALVINLALIASGYGIIVKIVEIALTLFGMFSVIKKNALAFHGAAKKCISNLGCDVRDIITMVQALTELAGLFVGSVYLSGITKIVKVKHVRAALKTKNIKLIGFKIDPELSMYVAQFARKINNAKTLIKATGTALKTRSTARLRVAARKIRRSPKEAGEMYASARSLVDDADEAARYAKHRMEMATAKQQKLQALLSADDSSRTADDFAKINKEYNSAMDELMVASDRFSGTRDAAVTARSNLDDFIRVYGSHVGGRKPSVKLMDEVTARFRQIYEGEIPLRSSVDNLVQTTALLKDKISMRLNGKAVTGSMADKANAQFSAHMAENAGGLLKQAFKLSEDFFKESASLFDDMDDVTSAVANVVMKDATARQAKFLGQVGDFQLGAMKDVLRTAAKHGDAKTRSSFADVYKSKEVIRTLTDDIAAFSERAVQRLQVAKNTLSNIVDRASVGVRSARGALVAHLASEDKVSAAEAAKATKDARQRSKDILDKSGIEKKVTARIVSKFEVDVVVRGVSLEESSDGEGSGGDFFVVSNLAPQIGASASGNNNTMKVSPEGEFGAESPMEEVALTHGAQQVSDQILRLYVFRRPIPGATGRDDLVGVAIINDLGKINTAGDAVIFDAPLWSLEDAKNLEGAVDSVKRYASSLITDDIRDLLSKFPGAGGESVSKTLEEAGGKHTLAGTVFVSVSVRMDAPPVVGLTSTQNFRITGTPPPLAKPEDELAADIAAALDGWGTKDEALIRAVTSIPAGKVAAVRTAFKAQFGGELVRAIRDDTSGDYEDALVRLVSRERLRSRGISFRKMARQMAILIHSATSGLFTSESRLTRALTYGDLAFNRQIAEAYQEKYGSNLIDRVRKNTGGNYRKLLTALIDPSLKTGCAAAASVDVSDDIQK